MKKRGAAINDEDSMKPMRKWQATFDSSHRLTRIARNGKENALSSPRVPFESVAKKQRLSSALSSPSMVC
jgi:hypothetical protein